MVDDTGEKDYWVVNHLTTVMDDVLMSDYGVIGEDGIN